MSAVALTGALLNTCMSGRAQMKNVLGYLVRFLLCYVSSLVRIAPRVNLGLRYRAVVVAQLEKRSLLTPEICGSNPDIG